MPNPLISIIIPTFERLTLLTECLQAIMADPYEEKEIIIINDAGAKPVSNNLIESIPKLQWLDQPFNQGHVSARNRGLMNAKGEWILLCDDDDLMIPGHISRLIQEAVKHPLALWKGDAEIIRYNTYQDSRIAMNHQPFALDYHRNLQRRYNTVIPSGVLYPAKFHEVLGPFDEAMNDYWDWDFILRSSEHYPIHRLPYASVLYMVSDVGDNLSSKQDVMSHSIKPLIQKHKLGDLPVSSFALMLEDTELQPYWQKTHRVWSGSLEGGMKLVSSGSAFSFRN